MSSRGSTLERSQRAHSSTALSAPSTFTPFTPITASGRPRSKSYSVPPSLSGSAYTERGFEVATDPFAAFESLANANDNRWGSASPLGRKARRRVQQTSYGARRRKDGLCFVEEEDEVMTRLGASASRFGAWNEGDCRLEEWSWRSKRDSDDEDEEEEQEEDREDEGEKRLLERQRTQSSLCVFHDAFEEDESGFVDSPSSSTPSTPALDMHRTLNEDHAPPSPTKTQHEDIDTAAHSFLATQDRWGLFAFVESLIEWPFSPSNSQTVAGTPALSRTTSYASLAFPTTPPAAPLELDLDSPVASGELWEYYRQRSEANLRLLAEEAELRNEEASRVRPGARAGGVLQDDGEEGAAPALKGVIDVLAGLGGFI